jgi:membrane-associated protease RseP (regulator of RpoE activity)
MEQNCDKIRELIPLGVSNDINPSDLSELQAHLSGCPDCQKEFGVYQSLTKSVGQLGEVKPQIDDAFWSAQRQRILSAVKPPPAMPTKTPVITVLLRYAAVLLIGLVAGLGLWQAVRPCPPQVIPATDQQANAQPQRSPDYAIGIKPQNNLLGAELEPLTKPVANHLGINQGNGFIISNLPDLSPAHKLGLKRGDIVLEINGQTITSTIPGFNKPFNIKIIRNGNVIEIGKK